MTTLVILSLVLGGVLFTLQLTRPARLGNEAARQIRSLVAESERLLAESREAEDAETAEAKLRRAARQSDQALRHLNSYLERNPDDPEMAILRAELMAERATGAGPYEERVAQIHQRILVRFSNLPKEELDEVRYRLADLYIRLSDALQADYQQSGLAEQVVAQGRYPAAIELAQALDPNDPRTQALLGKAYEGQRDIPTALDAYERAWELYPEALAKAPDDEKPIEGILEVAWRMARLYRDHPEVDGNADEVLTELASILPDSAEALLVRFFFYRESDDPEKAGQALEDARDQAPEDPKVLITLVEHSLEQGDTATAKTAFQAIPEDYHRENRQRVAMLGGLIDHYERRTADAMTQWDEGLKVAGGNDADLAWWLAYVSLKTGEIEKAKQLIDQFKRLSGGNDNDPRYQLLLALDANARGDVQNAITILEALRARRGNPPLVQNKATQELASCYVLVGKNEEAEALFQDVEAADSGSSLVLVISHADVLENLGRTREAIDLLTTARTTFDDDPVLLLLLLRLRLSEQSRQEPATRSWAAFDQDAERVQEIPEDVLPPQSLQRLELELMRADRHLLANQPDQADDRLKEAQKTWPTNSRLWAARAELLKRSGDPEAALALLEEGLKQAGDGPTLRLTLARLLVDLGRGREAQQRLIDGIDQLGSDAQRELWQALGRLRMAQGDYDGARAAFLSWSKLAPNAPEPILELIEVALLANRIPEAELYLDRLKLSNGENAISTRMAAASILLHQAERGDTEARDRCLTLVGEVLQEVPGLSSAHMLNGRIQEVIGNPEGAAEAYRTAWKQGNREALLRLVDQLVKLGQVEELEQLTAESGPGSAAGIRRVSAQALLAVGAGLDGADRLQDSAVEDPGAPAVANTVRARALLLAGRYDELEQLLDEQAEKQATPKNAAPWLELITTQVRLGRDQATLERTIDRALERSTGIPSELLEARLRWAIGDLQAADKVLEDALDNEIVNPDLMIGAASFYQQTGRPDRAEPLLERLMDNPSVAAGAALQLAMVLTERAPGDPETWKRARDLASNGPMTPERRLAIGVVQSRAPKPEQRREAIPVFETLMADLPLTDGRAVQARNQLARLLIELGEFDRAAQITEISADLSTAPAEAIVLHVRALLKADRLAEAGSQLSRLELLRPGDPEVADLRSDQLIRANAGNPSDLVEQVANRLTSPGGDLFARAAALQLLTVGTPEALEAADQIAQDLAQTTPGSQWVSGLVLAVRGRFEEALEQCAASLEAVDLTDQTARIGLTEAVLQAVQAAPITQRVDQVARARPIIATLLNKRPGDPDLLTASAILYHHAGDYQKEAELYREILERRPGDLLALYNLGLVLSEGLEQPEQGLAEIDRMERRVGPVPAVLGARGVILIRQKRFDEAIQALEQAVAIEPTAARHYYLALASLKSGRNDQFRTHLDQARTLGLDPNTIDPWHQDELQDILAR